MVGQALQMMQSGTNSDQIVQFIIQQNPNNQALQAMVNKSPAEIEQYAKNMMNSAGFQG